MCRKKVSLRSTGGSPCGVACPVQGFEVVNAGVVGILRLRGGAAACVCCWVCVCGCGCVCVCGVCVCVWCVCVYTLILS